jgi:hypothetical protein
MRDHYEVLGVSREADERTIRAAYLSLSLMHHPDKQMRNKSEKTMNSNAQQSHANAGASIADPLQGPGPIAASETRTDPDPGPIARSESSSFASNQKDEPHAHVVGASHGSRETSAIFVAISEAYEVLMDAERRKVYDATLAAGSVKRRPVTDRVGLSDLEDAPAEDDQDEQPLGMPCRCGDWYVLPMEYASRIPSLGVVDIVCPSCSFVLEVDLAK